MSDTSALLDRLGVALPVFQAPMAGVSSPAMAAAVSNAGGLGALGIGASTADAARQMIGAYRELSDKPLNVNVFTHNPATPDVTKEAAWIERWRPAFEALDAEPPPRLTEIYRSFQVDDAVLAMLLETKPAIVSFHFGLPEPARLQALRNAGITLFATVTCLEEARKAHDFGIDILIAQGYEAGGHRGLFDPDAPDDRLGTLALTRILARNIARPIVAAGGIMDGAGVTAALSLGASAAMLGTAYIATDESLADAGYRAALTSDAAHHTIMTRAISGRPARCLANRFTHQSAAISDDSIPDYPIAYDLGKALHVAGKQKGEFGYGAQWAGQGAPLSRSLPAGALTRQLALEIKA